MDRKPPSRLFVRLAKMIEKEMLEQHGIVVEADPASISIPIGFYRTSAHADCYRWTATTRIPGLQVGPIIDCYDTVTDSARYGFILMKDRRPNIYDATARNRN